MEKVQSCLKHMNAVFLLTPGYVTRIRLGLVYLLEALDNLRSLRLA